MLWVVLVGFLLVFIECWSLRGQIMRLEEKYSRLLGVMDEMRRQPTEYGD